METKFWKPKSFDFSSVSPKSPSSGGGNSGGLKSKLLKRFGIAGILLILLLALVGGLGFVFVGKPLINLYNFSGTLKADIASLKEAVALQDIDGINTSLDKITADLNEFRSLRDRDLNWAKDFPTVKEYYSDSDHFINAGLYAVDALKEFVVVASPFADAAGFKSQKNVEVVDPNAGSGLAEAFSRWVSVMPDVADKMDGVIAKFDKVGDEIAQVDASRYPESINGIPVKSNIEAAQQYLTKATEYGPDIKAALVVIPSILGDQAEKRYAIIMQNDGELRATGGFWTNYATFKIKGAQLNSDFTSKDMYSLDDAIALTDTPYTRPWPDPIPAYAQYLKVEHAWARDANVSPDFVTAVDNWMWYYNKVSRIVPAEAKPINGVFAMDTEVIRRLLDVTGPVEVRGVTYNAENVVLELERIASLSLKEQQNRKKVLGDVMFAMLNNMYKSERNLWPKFIETGINLAIEKHALAYVFVNPNDQNTQKAQELLEKYNFSGRIQQYDKGDYSYVVSTNLGGDKTNFFVSKEVVHNVTQEGGKYFHEVVINYSYNDPMPGYEPLVTTYRDWVRVYAPQGSKLVSIEGSDAKTASDEGQERGKVYFAGHITLPPKEKTTIKFKYEIPASVVKAEGYSVYLQKQPGTRNEKHIVNFGGKSQEAVLMTDKELIFK